MKTLLRHTSTGKYFQSLDKWTSDMENAHDFGAVRRGIRFAQKIGIPDLELVVSVEEPQQLLGGSFGEFIRNAMRGARKTRNRFGRGKLLQMPRMRISGAF
jgi:hypothetical protein